MNDTLKLKLNNSGFKKKYIAEQIGVHQSVLSMCIKGERYLPADKEQKLKDLLNKAS